MQTLLLQIAFGLLQVPAPDALVQQTDPRSPHLLQTPPVHFMSGAVHELAPPLETQQG